MFVILWIIAAVMVVAGIFRLANRDVVGALVLLVGAFLVATGFFGLLF